MDDERAYIFRVLKDKPPVKKPIIDPNGEKFQFVVLTDAHPDPYYKSGSEVNCRMPFCCRGIIILILGKSFENSDKFDKEKKSAGYWGSIGHCDIPYVLSFR